MKTLYNRWINYLNRPRVMHFHETVYATYCLMSDNTVYIVRKETQDA